MNYRFVLPLLATGFLEQTVISVVRVTTSYRAVEVGLSVVWIGIISAAFAILPIVLAVPVGRYIDRGHDATTARIGSALLVVACAGFAVWPTLIGLLVFTSLLGTGHLFLVISQQVLCTRHAGPGGLERMLGNYMVSNAIGQGVGPYIVGWAGGSASIPPTDFLFAVGAFTAALTFASALLLPRAPPPPPRPEGSKPVPVRDILRFPGLSILMFVSVVTVVAQDLIVIYMPLLGAERGMAVDVVGSLLAVRAAASMLSRFLFARLNELMGRNTLMIGSTFASAICYASLAAPLPLPLMYAMIGAAGFALGIAVTATIASVLALAGAALGTANSLRMLGNRIGQFTIPALAGLLAAATGVGGIFFILGLSLAVAGTAIQVAHRR